MTGPAKVEARGLAKTFAAAAGGEPIVALDGASLTLGAGELISIVGPSGCGKSTLLNLLAGLLAPTSGEVLLDGAAPDGLLGRIGYMPQKDLLMPWRTVLDNVTLGLEMDGMARRDARERARAELGRFGLAGFERRWPGELSGGMRQRAALLRTFLAGREVMLLDEPFGALDALTRQVMREWLLDIWQADRKSIVFVTHDVEEAIYLSDRVYVMSGRPGHMELDAAVALPRPRTFEMISSPQFVALKARLMAPLHEAAALQLQLPGAAA